MVHAAPRTIRSIPGVTLIVAALVAPSPSDAASPLVGHPAQAASAVQAVQMVLRPFDPRTRGAYNVSSCATLSPRRYPRQACPETARLRRYLSTRRLPARDTGLAFCRCQSPPSSVRVVARRTVNAMTVQVDARWDFGPGGFHGPNQHPRPNTYATDTFVVLKRTAGWLVDNEYCAGRPWTSVYNGIAGMKPCYEP